MSQLSTYKARLQRGSALLFVVVVLVLMAMLGAAYLQLARLDFKATAEVESADINTVVQSTLHYVGRVLYNDIYWYDNLNSQATYFNDDEGREPLDLPWTNPDADWPVTLFDGSTDTAKGYGGDDPWLAHSTFSTDASLNPYWIQVSNLGGIWVVPPALDSSIDQPLEIVVDFSATDPEVHRNTNLNITGGSVNLDSLVPATLAASLGGVPSDFESIGTHADQDGIKDSRFTWAPIRSLGDVEYITAYRIIDNSAFLNMAIAQAHGDGLGASYIHEGDARFWYPTALDAGRHVSQFNVAGTMGPTGELATLLDTRFGGSLNAGDTFLPTSFRVRTAFWEEGVAQGYPTGWRSDEVDSNELELRYAGGLNKSGITANIESATTGMPTFLRADATENDWSDVPGATSINDFALVDPRHQTTTISGAGRMVNLWRTVNPEAPTNIHLLWHDDDLTRRDQARMDFYLMLQFPDMPFQPPTPLTPRPSTPFGTEYTRAAMALTAAFIDYYDTGIENPDVEGRFVPDADSTITQVSDGTTTAFGMEALPFFTDVYFQAPYWLTAASLNGGTATPTDDYNLTWSLRGQIGYGIELYNPFGSPVRNLEHVRLVRRTGAGVEEIGLLSDLVPPPGVGASTLDARSGIVLRRASGGGDTTSGPTLTDSEENDIYKVPAGADLTAPAGWLENDAMAYDMPADADLQLELQVLVDPTTNGGGTQWITYARAQYVAGGDADRTLNFPSTVTTVSGSLPVQPAVNTNEYERWVQRSVYTRREGLQPIAVRASLPDDVNDWAGSGSPATGFRDPAIDGGDPSMLATPDKDVPDESLLHVTDPKLDVEWVEPFASVENIDETDKTVAGIAATRGYAFDDTAARYVTDIYRVMWVGPTDSLTYAEVFQNAAQNAAVTPDPYNVDALSNLVGDSLRTRMLSLTLDKADTDANSNYGVPRALLLMDVLTTLVTPDFDPTRDDIPGRLNINTGLAKVDGDEPLPGLPLDINLRTDLRDDIIEFRDDPDNAELKNTFGRGDPSDPALRMRGFASLGELFQLDRTRGTETGLATPAFMDSVYTHAVTVGGSTFQLAYDGGGNPILQNGSDYFVDYNDNTTMDPGEQVFPPVDDRTEEVRLVGKLANVFSVRSDFFTAYIVIRGYRTGEWSDGPVQSAKLIALFDRSPVRLGDGEQVRLLGVLRIE